MIYKDLIFVHKEKEACHLVEKLWGKHPLFTCVIGNTDTGKIKGISAAGAHPDITDFTPSADVELVALGRCQCIKGIPVTPEGIPTPAIITQTALACAQIPFLVVNAGVRVNPQIPFIDVGGKPGKDIRENNAVYDPEHTLKRAILLGKELGNLCDFLVVGESIAGGTTTALGVLQGLGYHAFGKVSSSLPHNPHKLKKLIVKTALKKLPQNPTVFDVMQEMGDPMIPVHAGVCIGAAQKVPVFMAGGTQMVGVLAVIKEVEKSVLNRIAIATTQWIVTDTSSRIVELVHEVASVPVIATRLSFAHARYTGLQVYEQGVVKEGVGAGGATIAAYLKTKGMLSNRRLLQEIETIYEDLCHPQKEKSVS